MSDLIIQSLAYPSLNGSVIMLWLKLTVLLCTGLILAKTTNKLLHRRFILRATIASAFAIPVLHAAWQSTENFAFNIEVPQLLTRASDAATTIPVNSHPTDLSPAAPLSSNDSTIATASAPNLQESVKPEAPILDSSTLITSTNTSPVIINANDESSKPTASPEILTQASRFASEPTTAPTSTGYFAYFPSTNWLYRHLLPVLWIAVSTLLLGKLLIDLYRTRRLIQSSQEASDQWKEIYHAALSADSLSVDAATASYSLKLNPFINSPCVVGHSRPVILIPCSMELSDLPQTLRHELTHIENSDWKWNLIGQVAKAIFWPVPLIRSIQIDLRKLSEDICDDTVLIHGHSAEQYANQLVRIAENSTTDPQCKFVIPMAASGSQLKRRIERIVRFKGESLQQISRSLLLGSTVISCLLTCALSAVAIRTVQADQEPATDVPTPQASQKPGTVIEFGIAENGERIQNVQLHGRATHADQSPCSDVLVQVNQLSEGSFPPSIEATLSTAITNAAGEFSLNFPIPRDRNFNIAITATKKGFVAISQHWPNWDSNGNLPEENVFEMVAEQPFNLNILEPSGEPHPNAKLRVSAVWLPESMEAASNWHLQVKNEAKSIPINGILDFPNNRLTFHMGNNDRTIPAEPQRDSFPRFPSSGFSVVQNDDLFPVASSGNGEYQISGLTKNSVALFELSGKKLQHQFFACFIPEVSSPTRGTVANRLKDYSTSPLLIDGNSPIQTEASIPLSGRLVDSESNSPIANATLRITNSYADGSVSYSSRLQPQATTDENGLFSIEGLRPRQHERIEITPATNTPYSPSSMIFDLNQASQRPDWTLSMKRGIWLEGTFTDDSGTPLKASISYSPVLQNPNRQKLESGSVYSDWNVRIETQPDGSFRIPVLPGKGKLVGTLLDPTERFQFQKALPPDFGPKNSNTTTRLAAQRSSAEIHNLSMAQVGMMIDIAPDEATSQQNIVLKRLPTAVIKLAEAPEEYTPIAVRLYPSGNSIEVFPNTDGTYTIPGLSDSQEQYVWIRTFGDNSKAKYLQLKGNTQTVTSVTLDSCCLLTGKTSNSQNEGETKYLTYSVTPVIPGHELEESDARYLIQAGVFEHWLAPGLVHKIKVYRDGIEIHQFDVESVSGKNYEVDLPGTQPTVRELP